MKLETKRDPDLLKLTKVTIQPGHATLRMSYPSLLINSERMSTNITVSLGKDPEPRDWQIYQQ